MRYARERVEPDIVGAREALQHAPRPLAQGAEFVEVPVEARHGSARELEQLQNLLITRHIGRIAAALHLS